MAGSVLVIGRFKGRVELDLGARWSATALNVSAEPIPPAEILRQFGHLFAVGPLGVNSTASELGGSLRLAAENGVCTCFLYPGAIEGSDRILLSQLLPDSPQVATTGTAQHPVRASAASFAEYLTTYGRSNSFIRSLPAGWELLGGSSERPFAFCTQVGRGAVYVLPYFAAGFTSSGAAILGAALRAIEAHRSGSEATLPEYLARCACRARPRRSRRSPGWATSWPGRRRRRRDWRASAT